MSSKEKDKIWLSFRGIPSFCPIMYFKQRWEGGHSTFSKQHVALGGWSLFKQVEGERTESICDGGEGAFRRKNKKALHTYICFKSPGDSKRVGARILNHDSSSSSSCRLANVLDFLKLFLGGKRIISSFPLFLSPNAATNGFAYFVFGRIKGTGGGGVTH